jgi:DNA-binding PadR family transcriptional regulator
MQAMSTKLNPTAASLLGFLHAGEASGYELLDIAHAFIGDFWTLTRSQVYRELAALAEHDLVEAGTTGARSRRPYRLTEAGRTAFAAWLAEPPDVEQIRYPLLLTLAFGAQLDAERLLGYVAAHRLDHERRLAEYLSTALANDLDPYQRATLNFGIHYERAVLAWMDELPDLLTRHDQPRIH